MLAADVGGYRLETTAASADGRVILIRNSSTEPGARLTVYSRSGNLLRILTQTRGASHVELSHDQKRLLYEFGPDLWVMDLERETTSRLTFGGNAGPGVWSADDSEVYFYEHGVENGRGIYSIASDGAGEGSRILDSAAHHLHASPDGRTLIYEDGTLDTANFRILDLIDSDHSTPYLESGIIRHPQISPDSRFVAYQAEDKGIWEIYVKRYPAGEGTWQISSGGGMQPRWRGDGKEIYYVTPEGQVKATEISLTENAVTQGKTEDLFRYRIGTIEGKSLNVSRDGQWFVVRELQPDAKPITGRILLNWPLGKL
jgi:Tol biopolymer transport system component